MQCSIEELLEAEASGGAASSGEVEAEASDQLKQRAEAAGLSLLSSHEGDSKEGVEHSQPMEDLISHQEDEAVLPPLTAQPSKEISAPVVIMWLKGSTMGLSTLTIAHSSALIMTWRPE